MTPVTRRRSCSAFTNRCTLARRLPNISRTSRYSVIIIIIIRFIPSASATGCSPASPNSRSGQSVMAYVMFTLSSYTNVIYRMDSFHIQYFQSSLGFRWRNKVRHINRLSVRNNVINVYCISKASLAWLCNFSNRIPR